MGASAPSQATRTVSVRRFAARWLLSHCWSRVTRAKSSANVRADAVNAGRFLGASAHQRGPAAPYREQHQLARASDVRGRVDLAPCPVASLVVQAQWVVPDPQPRRNRDAEPQLRERLTLGLRAVEAEVRKAGAAVLVSQRNPAASATPALADRMACGPQCWQAWQRLRG